MRVGADNKFRIICYQNLSGIISCSYLGSEILVYMIDDGIIRTGYDFKSHELLHRYW